MKKTVLLYALILTGLPFLIQSCSKKGDPGINGEDGAPGAPGNTVNVSDSFQFSPTDYVIGAFSIQTSAISTLGIFAKVATLQIPKLTQKIFSSGTVLVYVKSPSALNFTFNQYTSLPLSIRSSSVGYSTKISYAYEPGKLRIYYYYESGDAGATTPDIANTVVPPFTFKYVIIPGTEGFSAGKKPPVDPSDYKAVEEYYHLNKNPSFKITNSEN